MFRLCISRSNRLISFNSSTNLTYIRNKYCTINNNQTTSTTTTIEKNQQQIDINGVIGVTGGGERKSKLTEGIRNGTVPSLNEFMKQNIDNVSGHIEESQQQVDPFFLTASAAGEGRSVFVESYGCQMNFADSEIIHSVMKSTGYTVAESAKTADVVFLNTCAIRENAEDKIWFRLTELRKQKKQRRGMVVGVLGCMAERLKQRLLDSNHGVDLVVGPDAYRSLPALLSRIEDGQTAINVLLSADETYSDIAPVRHGSNGVSAYVSIMRGCNNMCSYCIVPFTRGRERSRSLQSIVEEVRQLSKDGYKEITLLGQNVNSYNYIGDEPEVDEKLVPREGFNTIYKSPKKGVTFTELMHAVSQVDPEMRIRFTSPHPKDFPDDLIELVKHRPNICRQFHIPAQSGNTQVLDRMRRGYSRESYIDLINLIRRELPGCAISSDFISGFCGETEQEHKDTLSLMDMVAYENAFMFAYSLREKTHAHRHLKDDVDATVKSRRLQEVIDLFYKRLKETSKQEIGRKHLVLVERISRRSGDHFVGRTDTNKKVIIPMTPIPSIDSPFTLHNIRIGDYVAVEIESDGSEITLRGKPISISGIVHFNQNYQ